MGSINIYIYIRISIQILFTLCSSGTSKYISKSPQKVWLCCFCAFGADSSLFVHIHLLASTAFICNYMFNTTGISAYISTLCILNVSIGIRYVNIQWPLVYHNINEWAISRRLGEFAEDTYDYLETQQRFEEACVLWYLDLIWFDDIGCSRYRNL